MQDNFLTELVYNHIVLFITLALIASLIFSLLITAWASKKTRYFSWCLFGVLFLIALGFNACLLYQPYSVANQYHQIANQITAQIH